MPGHEQPTSVLPIVGLDVGAIGSMSLFCFGAGGRNFFEHQNKFLILNEIMNFRCQAEVFQVSHHRQYLFVTCNQLSVLSIIVLLLKTNH